jgi:hypothetical protein
VNGAAAGVAYVLADNNAISIVFSGGNWHIVSLSNIP